MLKNTWYETATLTVTSRAAGIALPALIASAGDRASIRFLEFFTVTIRNKNTRGAYAHAAAVFLQWCETRGGLSDLRQVQPVHVAAYIEELQATMSAPSVKQHLACIRMLFDWLVTGQVIPTNPAHSVRGPRHSVGKGSTKVLASAEATELLKSIAVMKEVKEYGLPVLKPLLVGLRDRALIAVMTYAFARVGAVVALSVEDYYPQNKRWWLRLHEKNGKRNEMPCHHKLEGYLDAYIEFAGLFKDKQGPLFRSATGKTGRLSDKAMSRSDVWQMVRRRASGAGIETAIGCHTFRATGITDYLTNGGRIEVAQRMAGHSNAKTTGLYDRRADDISVSEVEKVGI